jgi:hypothetical protein
MGAAEKLSFTELSISVADVVPPTLTGFLDSGIDKIVSNAAVALFDMYESVLLKAMPNFFHLFVREKLNAFMEKSLQLLTVCESEEPTMSGFVDFRDLLLNPEVASSKGGSGRSPYGNVVNWVWELVQEQLFSADESGLLAMNDILVKPMTKAQSGEEGLVSLNQTLLDLNKDYVNMDIWRAFADHLRLSISNLRLSGLDTFREPFHILKPGNNSGHVLENRINIGTENRSLDAMFQFDIEVGGPSSPLATQNSMDLQLSFPPIELFAELFAAIDESKFMTMPLKNILNPDCWLSMMANIEGPSGDISKRASTNSAGLALHYFDMMFDDFVAKASCLSCSNKALESFNEIMSFLAENDFFTNVRSRGLSILREILESKWMAGVFEEKIRAATLRCPTDPNFTSFTPELEKINVPFQTSQQLVDGILYFAMSVVQVIAIVMAQKHTDVEMPGIVDISPDVPDNANLIDFTNLTSIASWADVVFKEANTYLGSRQQNDDGDEVLGIVNLLQSLLSDESGLLTIPIVDQGFEAGGVVLSVYNVTLIGLDSLTSFNVLNTTGPQTIRNTAKLDTLGVSVDMGLAIGGGTMKTITASLVLKDVDVDLSLFLAIDQGILRDMKLGSIMNTSNIFFCFLTSIHTIGLSDFVMKIGDIESFTLSGYMSDTTDKSIQKFTTAVFAEYKKLVVDAIPAFTATTVRPLLHEIFQVLIKLAKGGQCPTPDTNENDRLIDFRDLFLSSARSLDLLGRGDSPYGDLFRMLFNFIDDITAKTNEKGLSMMNDVLISRVSDGGNMHWSGEVFSREMDISLNGLNADISLAIKDVRLENLDTIGSPVRILQPLYGESTLLNNSVSLGVGDPLRVAFILVVNGEGDEIQVENELELGLSLSTAEFLVELLAKLKETSLFNFPLRDITNVNCWLATLLTPVLDQYGLRVGDKTLALQKVIMAVAEARLDMSCISCSSTVLLETSSFFQSSEGVEDTTRGENSFCFDCAILNNINI